MKNIKTDLSLRQRISLWGGQPQQFISKVALFLKKVYPFSEQQLFEFFNFKNSCGNQRPPQQLDHLYERAAGLLKLLLERPAGLKKILKVKSKLKRRGVQKPARRPSCSINKYLKYLASAGLIQRNKQNNKGHFTSKKGKAILAEILEELRTHDK